MFDITQFRSEIINPSFEALQVRSQEFKELVVFTCAVESAGGTYVKQIHGPAVGIYQIEPNSFTDLWVNYVLRKPDLVNLLSINCGLNRMPHPNDVITDLKLATCTCILYYMKRKVNPQAMDVDALWDMYKINYNTEKGAAQKEPSIKAYKKFIRA